MITSIVLENFKCFRKIEIRPRLITVLIGPNGTGKSSVLQALSLLKQSTGSNGIRPQGPYINLRSVADFIPKFSPRADDIHIEFAGEATIPDLGAHGFSETVRYRYGALFPSAGPISSNFGHLEAIFEGGVFTVTVPEKADPGPLNVALGNGRVVLNRGALPVARLVEWAGTQGSLATGATNGAQIVLNVPTRVLDEIRVVPSVRGLVRHVYQEGDDSVEDVSLTQGLSNQEEQLATNLGYSRNLESELSTLLKRVTRVGLRTDHVPPRSLEVKSLASGGDVNIVAEGFGANALILLLHQLIKTARDATLLAEEPEIHLHPRAQAEVASLLAENAKDMDRQLIMTTHSEHILGRLLTLVAEKRISNDELAIYSFEKDDEGICTSREIVVTEDGKVIGGLTDFFETDLAELDRYIRSLQPSE